MSKPIYVLTVLVVLVIGLYGLRALAPSGMLPLGAPAVVDTAPPPLDISKLHVASTNRVDLQCNGAPAIAPDGEHYVCGNGPDKQGLWLGSFGQGLEKRLAEEGGPAFWLPDGRAIVYAEILGGQPTKLYELETETGERTAISTTTYPEGGDHLQVLPGGRLVFPDGGTLYVWDYNTKTTQALHAIGCVDPTTHAAVMPHGTAVSPDGARIAEACAGSLTLIDVRAGTTITLSDQIGIFVKPMAWSPDGRQLAYSVQPDSTRVAELWLANADGSNPRRLWRDDQARAFGWLTWMPDGQTLLFVKNPGGSSFEVGWTYEAINVRGGPAKELFTNGEGLDLFANGSKILILRSVQDSGNWIVELAQ